MYVIYLKYVGFVFSPAMAYVLGGKNYKTSKKFQQFKHYCIKAYDIIRKNAVALETLLYLV